MMSNFYSTCIDNFLEDPDKLVDFSKKLPWKPTPGNFPGTRTPAFHDINEDLNTYLSLKILSVYFDFNIQENIDNVTWDTSQIYFQKVKKFSNKVKSAFNKGWIHKDNEQLAFVIYLNKNIPDVAGTNVYTLKENVDEDYLRQKMKWNMMLKHWFYTGKDVKENEYKNSIEEIENYFDESILFKPRYNRLVVYGQDFHSANNYWMPNEEERFFIVGFMNGIKCKNFPLQRIKNKVIDKNIKKNLVIKKLLSSQKMIKGNVYDKIAFRK